MMAMLIGWAASAGIPERFRKAAVFGILAVLAIAAFFGAKAIYDHSVITKHEQKAELKQAKRERGADQNLNVQKGRDEAAFQQRKQEIDNATRNIPDQAPSARQRARACVELQRQARERRKPQPAC